LNLLSLDLKHNSYFLKDQSNMKLIIRKQKYKVFSPLLIIFTGLN